MTAFVCCTIVIALLSWTFAVAMTALFICCAGVRTVVVLSTQSPLPLVNAHADELVEFLLHILGSAEAEMNLKDSSALVRAKYAI